MLDVSAANDQVKQLTMQSAAAEHVVVMLSTYKRALLEAWSGQEVSHIEKAVSSMAARCEELEKVLQRLSQNIVYAIEDVLAEEAAAAAASQSNAEGGA